MEPLEPKLPQESDEILTVQEVAKYLKVTPKTVYGLVREGMLPSFRVGRAVRCRRTDVESFIVRQEGVRDVPENRQPTLFRKQGESA